MDSNCYFNFSYIVILNLSFLLSCHLLSACTTTEKTGREYRCRTIAGKREECQEYCELCFE